MSHFARRIGVCDGLVFRAGARRVYWQTHETNATAMKLYDKVAEKSGFVVYRKIMYRFYNRPFQIERRCGWMIYRGAFGWRLQGWLYSALG